MVASPSLLQSSRTTHAARPLHLHSDVAHTTPTQRAGHINARGAVRLSDIHVAFGREQRVALSVERLDIAPGELVAFIGPSGCGKTTLLNVIGGMLVPQRGSVEIDGQRVHEPSPVCNVVFQQHSLFHWMSVRDNVAYGPRALGLANPDSIAQRLLQIVGLQDFSNAYPGTLSGGMQQRVAIARALATDPAVLLMDEPFGALDAQTRRIMQEELIKLRERLAPTVIFVTHDIDEALLLADRVFVMGVQPGGIRAEFDIADRLPAYQERGHCAQFIALRNELLQMVRAESLKVFNQ